MECDKHSNVSFRKISDGINPSKFYGSSSSDYLFEGTEGNTQPTELSFRFSRILGPSTVWKVFRKQHNLLEFISENNCGLFPFTYQISDGTRLFLAADPITFWHLDEQRKPMQRRSYEIIQEGKACKLYFDLEFDKDLNPNSDGFKMVNTFIFLVCFALRSKYNIFCQASDILNLDSSTSNKFSCHLIFPYVIFLNNFHAGQFVKQLCFEIMLVSQPSSNLKLLKGINLMDEINKLLVLDSKGKTKLFCDEAVYSKNRHFRLYKSSKFGKNVALEVSEHNLFEVNARNLASKEEILFLCSLITYCNDSKMKLTYECDSRDCMEGNKHIWRKTNTTNLSTSPYAEIDKCIDYVVHPGKIYRSRYFPEKSIIIYDIVGNRYCGNIGRSHKSNNVKYVVDIKSLTYYQKCYDPDCADFKSPKKKLPVDEYVFINNNIDDELVLAAADRCDLVVPTEPYSEVYSSSENEDLIEAAERCERMN